MLGVGARLADQAAHDADQCAARPCGGIRRWRPAKGPNKIVELLQRLATGEGVPALAREMLGMLGKPARGG